MATGRAHRERGGGGRELRKRRRVGPRQAESKPRGRMRGNGALAYLQACSPRVRHRRQRLSRRRLAQAAPGCALSSPARRHCSTTPRASRCGEDTTSSGRLPRRAPRPALCRGSCCEITQSEAPIPHRHGAHSLARPVTTGSVGSLHDHVQQPYIPMSACAFSPHVRIFARHI